VNYREGQFFYNGIPFFGAAAANAGNFRRIGVGFFSLSLILPGAPIQSNASAVGRVRLGPGGETEAGTA
jgi:hypothetical protein